MSNHERPFPSRAARVVPRHAATSHVTSGVVLFPSRAARVVPRHLFLWIQRSSLSAVSIARCACGAQARKGGLQKAASRRRFHRALRVWCPGTKMIFTWMVATFIVSIARCACGAQALLTWPSKSKGA